MAMAQAAATTERGVAIAPGVHWIGALPELLAELA
jgi:hypothetical protein